MSLRTPLFRSALRRTAAVRPLSTSNPRLAGHHDGAHGHDHGHHSGSIGPDDPAASKESVLSRPLIFTVLAVAGLSYLYNYAPSDADPNADPSASPSIFNIHARLRPWANPELWEARSQKLVEAESDYAYERRLFAAAERPDIIKSYDTRSDLFASPFKLPVGEKRDTTVETWERNLHVPGQK